MTGIEDRMMDDRQSKGGLVSLMAERIVALGVVALFVAMVVPALIQANRHRDIVRLTQNGQRLREAIIRANQIAGVTESMSVMWPTNSRSGSTEYFLDFFHSDLYTNAFPADWLAAPGVPVFSGTNMANFTASNNVWCIAAPLQGQTNDFPFLFTRNFSVKKDKGRMVSEITRLNPDIAPFGDEVGIVVSYRGAVRVIKADELTKEVQLPGLFNPTSETNQFLTPWAKERRGSVRR